MDGNLRVEPLYRLLVLPDLEFVGVVRPVAEGVLLPENVGVVRPVLVGVEVFGVVGVPGVRVTDLGVGVFDRPIYVGTGWGVVARFIALVLPKLVRDGVRGLVGVE